MSWYKRKSTFVWLAIGVILVIWMMLFYKVNSTFAVSEWQVCHLGESYEAAQKEFTWNSMQLMTQEEILEKFPELTKADIKESNFNDDDEYLAINVSVTNIGNEAMGELCSGWEIQCGAYHNGKSYLSSVLSMKKEQGKLEPGNTREVFLFFHVKQENKALFFENDIRIYSSLYPKRVYLEGRL